MPAQKYVAITIDDPNTTQTPLFTWQERNEQILQTLQRHSLKAALFVCGKRVVDSNGKALLAQWDKEQHLLCNHSFSHSYYHSAKISSKDFIEDFLRGDSIIHPYKQYTKLFRFPYLKEGNTEQKRDSMRAAMHALGYKHGYVTIDASDWFIDARVIDTLQKNPNAKLDVYRDYYVEHILNRAAYYDSLSVAVLGRSVKHTLLLHHNLLNSLFLNDVLSALTRNGWTLIDARSAFADPVFSVEPACNPCGESIIWQLAEQQPTISPTLRYPAEDGKYEEQALTDFIRKYAHP